MSEILKSIETGVQEIFPDMGTQTVSPDMELGEIPDWDSMSSVNFHMFLEQQFKVTIPQDFLAERTTIQEVIDIIQGLNNEKVSA